MNRRIRICLSSQLYWRNLTYQSINNVTPGPASTGLLYDIVLVKLGVLPSVLAFLIWRYNSFGYGFSNSSLPGALGMFGVALGIRNIQSQLPDLVYALLSGLNAATVGLIAVAAVQLSERAITNKMTRFLIAATASVGILYQGRNIEKTQIDS